MAIRSKSGEKWVLETDPECRNCGCKDIINKHCRYCGRRWVARMVPKEDRPEPETPAPPGGVIYKVVKCPECGSKDTKVTSTRRPIRHHKCKSCEHCFKSVEE